MPDITRRLLLTKLGVKNGCRALLIGVPENVGGLKRSRRFSAVKRERSAQNVDGLDGTYNYIHYFETSLDDLQRTLPRLRRLVTDDGMIWVSWPKKSSGIETSLSENVIRAEALSADLVDSRMCAVSDLWSGLKLVLPKAARAGSP